MIGDRVSRDGDGVHVGVARQGADRRPVPSKRSRAGGGGLDSADRLRACPVGQGWHRLHPRDLPHVEGAEADPPAVA